MFDVRSLLWLGVLTMSGCSPDPAPRHRITGDGAAVAGWPHHPAGDRFLVESCCTLRLASDNQASPGQGIDSAVHDVSGPGYVLTIVFGPHDTGRRAAGYQFDGRRIIDGVELNAFRWTDRARDPPEGRLLWLARVGGGIIGDVEHTPWGLRIASDCRTLDACSESAALVGTIRF